jgi:hypothetical protein
VSLRDLVKRSVDEALFNIFETYSEQLKSKSVPKLIEEKGGDIFNRICFKK